jgi:hypothetical protein
VDEWSVRVSETDFRGGCFVSLSKRAIAEFIGTFWLVFGDVAAQFSPPQFPMLALAI